MNPTAFSEDLVLTNFLTDYLDGELDEVEVDVFEDYLDNNQQEKEFARKAKKGKEALEWLVSKLDDSAEPTTETTSASGKMKNRRSVTSEAE